MTQAYDIAEIIDFTNTEIPLTDSQRDTLAFVREPFYGAERPNKRELYKGQEILSSNKWIEEIPPEHYENLRAIAYQINAALREFSGMTLSGWPQRIVELAGDPEKIDRLLTTHVFNYNYARPMSMATRIMRLTIDLANKCLKEMKADILHEHEAYPVTKPYRKDRARATLISFFKNDFVEMFPSDFYGHLESQKNTDPKAATPALWLAFEKCKPSFVHEHPTAGRFYCPMHGMIGGLMSDIHGAAPMEALRQTIAKVLPPLEQEHKPTCPADHGGKKARESLVPRG